MILGLNWAEIKKLDWPNKLVANIKDFFGTFFNVEQFFIVGIIVLETK